MMVYNVHIDEGTSEINSVGGYRITNMMSMNVSANAREDQMAIDAKHRNTKKRIRKMTRQNRIISASISMTQKEP